MPDTDVIHCPSNVVQRDCDMRHRGITKWLGTIILLTVAMFGTSGAAYISARSASQDVAVQTAVQEEVNKRVLDSLDRIETDVRILRNGHDHP